MLLKSPYSPFPKHKPLLLLHIGLFHISSQIKCYSSEFLRTPRAAEEHMRSSRAHWPAPGSGAAPPGQRSTVMTATDGSTHTWTGCTQGWTRRAAHPTPPWCLIQDRTFSFNRIKSQLIKKKKKFENNTKSQGKKWLIRNILIVSWNRFSSVQFSSVAQSCPTLCNLMDCSPPDYSVHGIFQVTILEWAAISFSRGSSQPRDQNWVSHTAGRLYHLSRQGI